MNTDIQKHDFLIFFFANRNSKQGIKEDLLVTAPNSMPETLKCNQESFIFPQ